MTQPDPDAIRAGVLALVAAVEHDPATVESITVTPGRVEVRAEDAHGRVAVWVYEWTQPLVP